MDKSILRKWLKAGFIEKHVLHPTEEGTPQGGLCKALHKPPYAKWKAMQSKGKKSLKLLHVCPIYFA
jgi:RNA-directed DNA polymerase